MAEGIYKPTFSQRMIQGGETFYVLVPLEQISRKIVIGSASFHEITVLGEWLV